MRPCCIFNTLKPSGHYTNHQFKFKEILLFVHMAYFMCFVWISEQRAIISLYYITDWFVRITV